MTASPEPSASPKKSRRAIRALVVLVLVFAAGAWASAPDLPKETLVAKYGTSPSKFLDLPSGARAHYRDQGRSDGPLLLLLHGSNSSLHTWEPWVRLLGDTFRIVTVDLPGHGLTGAVPGDDYSPDGMAKFVDEFRRTIGLERFFLAGNSMGGHTSWRFTLAHPDAVEKLVLVDASGLNHLLPPDQQPAVPIGIKILRTPVVNRLAEVFTPRNTVEKTTRAIFVDQSKVTADMVDRYRDLLRYPGNRRASRLKAGASVDLSAVDRLGTIHVPTLILSGTEDNLVPVHAARLFRDRIPGSTLIEYENVGHVPMEEIPERSAGDVRAFLRTP